MASRSELLRTVEEQREKLQKYEAKIKDIVHAYKGLMREKEALENSFKVLSATKEKAAAKEKTAEAAHSQSEADSEKTTGNEKSAEAGDSQTDTNKSEQTGAEKKFSDPLRVNNDQVKQESTEEADQLRTLSDSLYTLTQEKSKLEASYIADKKRLIQEKADLQSKLDEETEKNEKTVKSMESKIQELKSRICEQQKEREKEQNDHALMLRELQKLLAEERTKGEVLESKLEDVSEALKEKEKLVPNMSGVYEKKIKELTTQLQTSKVEVRSLREKARLPTPELLALQREFADLKRESELKHQRDQDQESEVEARMEGLRQQGESRVSSLESKLSELSEMVGTYERQKVQDQQTINKLKERVTQLDLENTALARAAQDNEGREEDPENLDVQNIADRIVKLKGLLREGNKRTAQPILIQDLLTDEDSHCMMCKKLKEDLEMSREEFERYKLRAQSVLKNKVTKDAAPNKEMELLKSQVTELREKIKHLHIHHDEELERQKQKADNASKAIISLQDKHKQDLLHHDAEHQHQVSQLEIEIKKQRERTVSLLAEKDREIEMLRASAPVYDVGYLAHIRNPPDAGASEEMQAKSEEEQAVSRLLKMSSMGQGEANLLYFSQEQARKEVEINSLRKQKHELESALRDLQLTSFSKEEALQEQLENMKEEVRKVERNIAREGANLEYLKNVTYKFLTSVDPKAKQQMLNAITTILQFSPQEKSVVHTQLRSWWTGAV